MKRTLLAIAITLAALTAPALALGPGPLNPQPTNIGCSRSGFDNVVVKQFLPVLVVFIVGAALMRRRKNRKLRQAVMERCATFRLRLSEADTLAADPDASSYLATELVAIKKTFEAFCNNPDAYRLPPADRLWKICHLTERLESMVSAVEQNVGEICHARTNRDASLTSLGDKIDMLGKQPLTLYPSLSLDLARAYFNCAKAIAGSNDADWQRFQKMINIGNTHCRDAEGKPDVFRPAA